MWGREESESQVEQVLLAARLSTGEKVACFSALPPFLAFDTLLSEVIPGAGVCGRAVGQGSGEVTPPPACFQPVVALIASCAPAGSEGLSDPRPSGMPLLPASVRLRRGIFSLHPPALCSSWGFLSPSKAACICCVHF